MRSLRTEGSTSIVWLGNVRGGWGGDRRIVDGTRHRGRGAVIYRWRHWREGFPDGRIRGSPLARWPCNDRCGIVGAVPRPQRLLVGHRNRWKIRHPAMDNPRLSRSDERELKSETRVGDSIGTQNESRARWSLTVGWVGDGVIGSLSRERRQTRGNDSRPRRVAD